MNLKQQRFLSLALIIAIFVVPIWLSWPGDSSQDEPFHVQEIQSETDPFVMDKILAKDLSLTTSLFINQLSTQFKKWKSLDLNSADWKEKFREEIKSHQHIHALALVKQEQIELYHGDISADKVTALLNKHKDKDVIYSDPYTSGHDLLMLVAHQKDKDEWLVGEVNLAFVKQYVKDMASVADANGNMFISPDNEVQVDWNKGHDKKRVAKETVPELNWEIIVQSKGKKEKEEHFQQGQAVVRFKEHVQVAEWLKANPDIKVLKSNEIYYVLAHDKLSTDEFVSKLGRESVIQHAEPNYNFTKQQDGETTPNDEFFQPYQWNLKQIESEVGWNISEGAEHVIIAVLDTGIDLHHEDLADKLITGYNAFDGSTNVQDEHGHGTHVAGIAAAVTNNLTGIAGVSWYNPILPVKVLNKDGTGSLFEVADGIKWATDHGARVINLSLGDAIASEILYDAIRYAHERDVVLIAAAGNDNVADPMYPAAYPEVLAVAAVDQGQNKASFSNYGPHIDVTAPGENIPSTFPGNNYVFMSGTSMAAPHVAGLAGLIRALNPELSNQEVVDLIKQTADDLGPQGVDEYFGYGQINVAAALKALQMNDYTAEISGENRSPFLEWLMSWFGNKSRK